MASDNHGLSSTQIRPLELLHSAIRILILGLCMGWTLQVMMRLVAHSNLFDIVDIIMFQVLYDNLAFDLTLIGITGVEDPLHDSVCEAVAKCQKAGVTVKMCTGDNVITACLIALQCGIHTEGGIIIEGPFFRQLSEMKMLNVISCLQVLAHSSPKDKKIPIEKLRSLGEIVGVTGAAPMMDLC